MSERGSFDQRWQQVREQVNVAGDYVKTVMQHPPTLYGDLRRVVGMYRGIMVGLVFVECVLGWIFWRYVDRYLLAWEWFVVLGVFLSNSH
ncbi:hypothetical protein KFU94_48400 [Chloroflexi bacterium TSY]|nr:hypothetical protein [Chloroflexi bacterium TSY]